MPIHMIHSHVYMQVIHREPPRHVFNKLNFDTTLSNYDRVKVLQEYGGIYLDFDVLVTQSFDSFRKHKCTLGRELPTHLNAGVIICAPEEPFLYLWLNSYFDDYKPIWAYNSGAVAHKLSQRYPHLIHIEENRMHHPSPKNISQIWGPGYYPWKNNYVIHTRIRKASLEYFPNETTIRRMNNTFGRVA